jgi:hypothetical protein
MGIYNAEEHLDWLQRTDIMPSKGSLRPGGLKI